jgi:hypothetical protein
MRAGSTKNRGRRISRSILCESRLADRIEQQLTLDVKATARDLMEKSPGEVLSESRKFASRVRKSVLPSGSCVTVTQDHFCSKSQIGHFPLPAGRRNRALKAARDGLYGHDPAVSRSDLSMNECSLTAIHGHDARNTGVLGANDACGLVVGVGILAFWRSGGRSAWSDRCFFCPAAHPFAE